MYTNVTVNTHKMAIATVPAARLQRLTPLSWSTLTGLYSALPGDGRSSTWLYISSEPMELCDALFSNYFEDLLLVHDKQTGPISLSQCFSRR